MQQLNGGPHTVHLHGACVSDQQLIVVMELLEVGGLYLLFGFFVRLIVLLIRCGQ